MTRFLHLALSAILLCSCASAPKAQSESRASVSQPHLVPISESQYQLAHSWAFPFRHQERIPAGLVVDGASVPRIAWFFMPPDGLHRAGALAHDWMYLHRGRLMDGCTYTRKDADLVFYNLMLESGVSENRAGIAYRCVRMVGWRAWNSVEEPIILPVIEPMSEEDAAAAPRKRMFLSHIFAP